MKEQKKREHQADVLYTEWGKKILLALSRKFKSQAWLAERCGVTSARINQIIKGKSLPSLSLALKISRSLGVSVNDLFFDVD